MIKVIYNKTCGRCVQSEPLTSGMVGQPIELEYSADFDGLTATAVFTDGKNTINVVNPGNECIIPHEVLTNVGSAVKVGIYAVKGDELVIPTIYANIGIVLKGADPSGDVSIDPTLPVWAQTQAMIGNLNDLTTEAKNNLVAAINEAAQTGGGTVPKPLTYDYMPEGYPTKSVQITTLMEEQEVAFVADDIGYLTDPPIPLEIVVGQTYTVNWDGTEYERVCVVTNPIPALGNQSFPVLGNQSIYGWGDDTGEPFLYAYSIDLLTGQFTTLDTSASHTISVKTTDETITPMAEEFIPKMNVSAFTNDAGYLTLATLPKYGGESV